MVESKTRLARDIEPREKPTGGKNRTREATRNATNILDEVAAAADKAAVADVATVNAASEMIATKATRATVELAGEMSVATVADRKAISSQIALRGVKNVDSAARWATCRRCVKRRPGGNRAPDAGKF